MHYHRKTLTLRKKVVVLNVMHIYGGKFEQQPLTDIILLNMDLFKPF